jgi:hypothetical protein
MNYQTSKNNIGINLDQISHILDQIREEEYNKANYVPDKEVIITKTSGVNGTYELDKFKHSINNANKKKSYNLLLPNNYNDTPGNFINILDANDNIFNRSSTDTESEKWKDLLIDDKISKIDEFFEFKYGDKNISVTIYEQIINLVNISKLQSKQDIIYDRVNCKIINIPLIRYNITDRCYYLHHNIPKKKTKKLFR